jgi:hypothetical protein
MSLLSFSPGQKVKLFCFDFDVLIQCRPPSTYAMVYVISSCVSSVSVSLHVSATYVSAIHGGYVQL